MNSASEIQSLVEKFVDEITVLAKREALEQISVAFGVSTPSAPADAPTSRGDKRSPALLAELKQLILDHVISHPGLRTEQLNAALGTSTKLLVLPLRQLVAAGALKTEGQRRGTKYYVAAKSKTPHPVKRRAAT